jgi:hypothetical protein
VYNFLVKLLLLDIVYNFLVVAVLVATQISIGGCMDVIKPNAKSLLLKVKKGAPVKAYISYRRYSDERGRMPQSLFN